VRRALGVILGLVLVAIAIWMGLRARPRHAVATDGGAATAPTPRSSRRSAAPTIRLFDARVEGEADAASGELAGRVVSVTSGQGVPRATLTFFHEGAAHTTATDASGAFRFRAPAPGRYQLASATAEGFVPFEPELGQSPIAFDARAGVRLGGVTLFLTPIVSYEGRVVDRTGKPVAGAEVRVIDPAGDKVWTSDDKGEFGFTAPDYAMLEASHPKEGRGRATLDLSAQAARALTIKLGDLPAPAAGPIAGVVVDERGPVDGAPVVAACDGNHPAKRTLSGADGRFELRGLDDCAHKVVASQRGRREATAENVRPGTTDLRLVLSAGVTLKGRVVDSAGKPHPAFTVIARLAKSALESGDSTTQSFFDDQGRFELNGLQPGTWRVQAAANGQAPSPEKTVEVPGEVELVLSRGGRIRGQVVDRVTHKPLAGARVSVEGGVESDLTTASGAATDDNGQFLLGGLSPGLCSITVAAQGHNPRLIGGLRPEADGELGPLTIDLSAVDPGDEPRMEFVGIGVVMSAQGDALVIQKVMPGSGAAEVGLVEGDGILSIDGTAATDLGFMGAIQKIRGPEGTTVDLVVRRKAGGTGPVTVPRRALNNH
jgi:uncharacterized GH25 family protein